MPQFKYFQLSNKSADIISMFCLNKVKPDDASLNFLIMSVIQTEIDNGRLTIHPDDNAMKGYDSDEEEEKLKERYKRIAKEQFERELAQLEADEAD